MHSGLVDLLRDIAEQHGTFRQLLDRAVTRGVPLPEVLSYLDFDDYDELREGPDGPMLTLLYAREEPWWETLSDVVGGDVAAQDVLARTAGWMSAHTIEAWRDQCGAQTELSAAVVDDRDPERLRSALERARACLSDWAVRRAIADVSGAWPLGTLVRMDFLPRDVVVGALMRRGSWPELLDAAEAEAGPGAAAWWMATLLDQDPPEGDSPPIQYLTVAARVRGPLSLSLTDCCARVSRSVNPIAWMRVAFRYGVPASHALLVAADSGSQPVDAAPLLSIAGWSDADVIEALSENGIGPSRALEDLRVAGWQAPRMVAALRMNGLLDAEIREELRHLGLSVDRANDLLGTALAGAPER